jgi:antitoxin ParD1/3/4
MVRTSSQQMALTRTPTRSSPPYRLFEGFENLMPAGHTPATLVYRHNLSYYEAMPMTSLNISLPEALKQYVERQVATGDWGTPSEYVRELIRQDKERRLVNLEQELVAAAKGPKIEIPPAEIRRKGLISALRGRARSR